MAAYRVVYDSRHLQAYCKEPGSAPEAYARQSNMGYLYLFSNPTFLRGCFAPGRAYSKRVPRTNCALRIKKCAPWISSGIYFYAQVN